MASPSPATLPALPHASTDDTPDPTHASNAPPPPVPAPAPAPAPAADAVPVPTRQQEPLPAQENHVTVPAPAPAPAPASAGSPSHPAHPAQLAPPAAHVPTESHDAGIASVQAGLASAPEGHKAPAPWPAVAKAEEAHRRISHKEVERRRRQTINDGIEALASMVPGCGVVGESPYGGGRAAVNKGSVLSRAVEYIKTLKSNEAANIEKWTVEKLLMDQALADASAHAQALSSELDRIHALAHKLGFTHLLDPRAEPDSLTLPPHLRQLEPATTTAPAPAAAAAAAAAAAPAHAPGTGQEHQPDASLPPATEKSTTEPPLPPHPAPLDDAMTAAAAAAQAAADTAANGTYAKRAAGAEPGADANATASEKAPPAKRAKEA